MGLTNQSSLVERLRDKAAKGGLIPIHDVTIEEAADAIDRLELIEIKYKNLCPLLQEQSKEIERLTRQRDTYRHACEVKQDRYDRLLMLTCPGELSAQRKAELRASSPPEPETTTAAAPPTSPPQTPTDPPAST